MSYSDVLVFWYLSRTDIVFYMFFPMPSQIKSIKKQLVFWPQRVHIWIFTAFGNHTLANYLHPRSVEQSELQPEIESNETWSCNTLALGVDFLKLGRIQKPTTPPLRFLGGSLVGIGPFTKPRSRQCQVRKKVSLTQVAPAKPFIFLCTRGQKWINETYYDLFMLLQS